MNSKALWIAFRTIVAKEIRRYTRIWVQTLIPPVITMSLYFVIFGNLIGKRIGDMNGFDYMSYIVPGLIMMTVITNSYSNVVSSFYSSKFQNFIQEILVSPMPNVLVLLGFVIGGVSRGLLIGFIVTIISMLFADLHIQHPLIMISIIFLTSVLFSLGGLINAIYAKSFDDISIIPSFILVPLTYFGGVFYSINLLPEFWRNLSMANPILYMVNAFRYGVLGVSDIDISRAFIMLIFLIIAMFLFALHLLKNNTGLRG